MMKRLWGMTVAALTANALLAGPAFCSPPNRPPTPFTGAWSYSNSASHDGSSWSESLSVAKSAGAGSGFADIQVEEMVNGVTHTRRQDHVRFGNVNSALERLITQAKKGL